MPLVLPPSTAASAAQSAYDKALEREEVQRIRVGRVWEVMPVCGPFLRSLLDAGMEKPAAAFILFWPCITLGAGEKRYDHYRKELVRLLKEVR